MFDWLSALPGPTWLSYLVLLVPSIALSNSTLWLSGLKPVGELDPTQVFWGVSTVAITAATHRLRNVAGWSFDAFRPALGNGAPDPERVRYELTVMPAAAVLAITVFSIVATPLFYVTDPVASQVEGLTGLGLLARILSEGGTSVVVLAILLQAIRQMRRVSWLHEVAENVDPFRPAPLHAFPRLTAQAAIVLILFNVIGFAANPAIFTASGALLTVIVPWLAAIFGGAIVIFVVPLLGMHQRLQAAKARLQGEAEERLKTLLAELNRDIDSLSIVRADGLNKLLASQLAQRDVLARLPTWPWSPGTVRGFTSALFLPIVLFLVQRALGEVLR